jgi:hypothetical protein
VLVSPGTETAACKTYVKQAMLEDYWDWDKCFESSHLASQVTLTAEMNGSMTLYISHHQIVGNVP